MRLTLLDTETGEKRKVDDDITSWGWAEGNWSCDCNRADYFGEEVTREFEVGICAGSTRFLVVDTDNPEYSLKELNGYYPDELLEEHLPEENLPDPFLPEKIKLISCQRCLKVHAVGNTHNLKYRETFPLSPIPSYRDGVRISLETTNKGCICPECVENFGVKVSNWFNWEEKDE